ncbi:MAG: restriction endonuclease [Candidatus Altiarchaeota archaeon]
MARAGVFAGLSFEEFKSSVSRLVSTMGYSVDSSKNVDDGFVLSTSKLEPLGTVKTLIRVFASEKHVQERKVRDVLHLANQKKIPKVVLISTSSFSDGALRLAAKSDFGVIDKNSLEDLMSKQGIQTAKKEKIFELAFDLGKTLAEARDHFGKCRGRKLFGFGIEEKIVEVVGRYAPVGCFMITRSESLKTGLMRTLKTLSNSNVFYVNLNSNELYYISRGLGKPVSLQGSNLLNRLLSLPVKSARMLAEVMKNKWISIDELTEKYELFYSDNRGDFTLLIEEGLVTLAPDRNGFMPNLTIPEFSNQRYDLRKFISVGKSVSSSYLVDELVYKPDDVLKLLELFFAGGCEFKEVIYLPYYTATYADDRGMGRSKVLLAPKYIV